ncbi:MAG: hypothetical protein V4580_13300 [Bacteroidota bacterium]
MLQIIFITITLLSFILLYLGTGKDKRVLLFYLCWISATGVLSYAGFFQKTDTFPPRLLIIIIPSVLYVIYFYRKLNTNNINLNYLFAIHALRLPVELCLFRLFIFKKIPVIMTFEGWNFDIIIGISALLLLCYSVFLKKKINDTFLKVWNVLGLIFLTIIVITAILSVPSPFQKIAFDQPNIAILEFPFTFLPAIIVPTVLLAHLLYFKSGK